MKFDKLECVVLAHDVPEYGLRAGALGTVVEVYPEGGVEIEFVRGSGATQSLLTLSEQDVRKIDSLELEQAKNFLRWVTYEDLSPIEKPDCTRPSRPGGHPDYVFQDSGGRVYVLELTRLLTPELRRLEDFVANHVCKIVENRLPGTYTLGILLTDPSAPARISLETAENTAQEILKLIQDGSLQKTQHLSTGFDLTKVREDGNRLVPWITSRELPSDLTDAHPVAKELRHDFEKRVYEANCKFRDYDGFRVLLINTSQSGLNLGRYLGESKYTQGVLLTWVGNMSLRFTDIDFIYLDPCISVWQFCGDDMHRVLTGHRYVDKASYYYLELWHRPGIPSLPKG